MGDFLFRAWLPAVLSLLLLFLPLTLVWWAFRQKHKKYHVKSSNMFVNTCFLTIQPIQTDGPYRWSNNMLVKLVYPAPYWCCNIWKVWSMWLSWMYIHQTLQCRSKWFSLNVWDFQFISYYSEITRRTTKGSKWYNYLRYKPDCLWLWQLIKIVC